MTLRDSVLLPFGVVMLAASCAGLAPPRALPGYILLSQHRGTDGNFWYRTEAGPMAATECRATLKRVTTRERVGFTKWYDVTMPQLEKHFGHAATPTLGSWLACWPEGTILGEPDS